MHNEDNDVTTLRAGDRLCLLVGDAEMIDRIERILERSGEVAHREGVEGYDLFPRN